MLKTKVVINPNAANKKTGKLWPQIEQKLQAAIGPVCSEMTTHVGSAIDITRQSLKDGFEQIIAVGGDGTLSEVVNGFFENELPLNPDGILGVVMTGTGGDFRRTLGLEKGVDHAIRALAEGTPRPIDVGKVTFIGHDGIPHVRFFDNIASCGMSGEIDMRVNQASVSKWFGGTFTFLWATLMTLIFYRNKDVTIIVDDQEPLSMSVRTVAVANGQYAGGGMWLAPSAKIDDGLLEMVAMGDISRIQCLMNMQHIYQGSHIGQEKILHITGKRVVISSEEKVLLDVDGEAPGRLPATFEILPGILRFRF